jgi:hypothetical protein
MSTFIAALPMYDWPERRAEVDAEWVAIRDLLRAAGVEAPEVLTRGREEHDVWRDPQSSVWTDLLGADERRHVRLSSGHRPAEL